MQFDCGEPYMSKFDYLFRRPAMKEAYTRFMGYGMAYYAAAAFVEGNSAYTKALLRYDFISTGNIYFRRAYNFVHAKWFEDKVDLQEKITDVFLEKYKELQYEYTSISSHPRLISDIVRVSEILVVPFNTEAFYQRLLMMAAKEGVLC